MKVVGKRKVNNPDTINDSRILQHTLNQIRGIGIVKKGLYRFRSFEAADAWMQQQIVNANQAIKKPQIT